MTAPDPGEIRALLHRPKVNFEELVGLLLRFPPEQRPMWAGYARRLAEDSQWDEGPLWVMARWRPDTHDDDLLRWWGPWIELDTHGRMAPALYRWAVDVAEEVVGSRAGRADYDEGNEPHYRAALELRRQQLDALDVDAPPGNARAQIQSIFDRLEPRYISGANIQGKWLYGRTSHERALFYALGYGSDPPDYWQRAPGGLGARAEHTARAAGIAGRTAGEASASKAVAWSELDRWLALDLLAGIAADEGV